MSTRVRVALAAAAALALLVWAFDWTWFRPLIQHHVHERSGRRIDFDELHIGLNGALQPTVRVRNLRVQNAPWGAADRPLVEAAVFDFSLSWESLRGERLIVPKLVLVDADLDLERQADGLRNWRLTRPDDRGPGRVRVLSVDAQRTRARVVHRGMDLELELQTAPLASPQRLAAHADLPLTKSLSLRGTRDGMAFRGEAAVSEVLTFFDTGNSFALRGRLETAQLRLGIEGIAHDLLMFAGFDVDLHFTGKRLSDVAALIGVSAHLPVLPADGDAHVRKDDRLWTISRLQARLGASDLAGTLEFRQKSADTERSTLHARLSSERLNLAELRAHAAGRPRATSDQPAAGWRLPDLDGQLEWAVGKLEGVALGSIDMLRAQASLRAGRLSVAPFEFAIAGGHAAGTLTLDSARSPAEATAALQLKGVRLDPFVAAHAHTGAKPVEGQIAARVAMHSRGDSLAALVGAAAGSVKMELVHASIPSVLDAKLGLDGGRWLRSLFKPGDRAAISCSALELWFDAGKGRVRRLAFETERVALTGTGSIDLARESFDVLLTPRRKQVALLALDRAVQVNGTFSEAKVSLVDLADTSHGSGNDACVPGTAH